jgi:hypothetical protein
MHNIGKINFKKIKFLPRTCHESAERLLSVLNLDARRGGWSRPHSCRFTSGDDPVPTV